jgi:hypothetical protein
MKLTKEAGGWDAGEREVEGLVSRAGEKAEDHLPDCQKKIFTLAATICQ